MIKVGDRLPNVPFWVIADGRPVRKDADEVFAGRKVVLFAVPGAFTPTCSKNHLPGFITNADAIKSKGVDVIAVTSVNDAFVMNAWKAASGADGKIDLFLADGNADFANATGLSVDNTSSGRGTRSARYSMIIEDGVLKSLNIEEKPGQADISGAVNLLGQL